MSTLKLKVFFFLALAFFVPAAAVYHCYTELVTVHANEKIAQELKEVELFTTRNNQWSDSELIHAQYLRMHTNYAELQEAFSLWIQARSEGGEHLIKLRYETLQKIFHDKAASMEAFSTRASENMLYTFIGAGGFLFFSLFLTYGFMKRRVFTRLAVVTQELGRFRVSEYQTKLSGKMPEDEISDLWAAFHGMVANLYSDLHEDLDVSPTDSLAEVPPSPAAAQSQVQTQVQAFLVERRIRNDRRSDDRRKRA